MRNWNDDLEELSEAALRHFQTIYLKLAEEAREKPRKGEEDTGVPGGSIAQ